VSEANGGLRIAARDPGGGDWMPPEELTRADADRFRRAGWVVIDHPGQGLRSQLTRIHALDPTVQVIVLAAPEERAEAERTLLFTPGVGEVWIAGPDEADGEMLSRAADVTRRRRGFRRTRATLQAGLRRMGPTKSERAQVSDAFLAALLEVVPDPVLSLAVDGRVVSANPATGRLVGQPVEELEGKLLADLLEVHDPAELERLLELGAESAASGELLFRDGAGNPGVAEVTVTPVRATKHEIRCVVLHDVTEERRIQGELARQAEALEDQAAELEEQAAEQEATNLELQERTEELEQAMDSRGRFYAAMSHELRTPLNAIIGYNALVLDGVMGELPEKMESPLKRSQRAAHHLLELVNDVLDLAKIEAGRVEINLDPVSFPEIVEELVDTVGPLAREHGSTIQIQRSGRAPPGHLRSAPRAADPPQPALQRHQVRRGRAGPGMLEACDPTAACTWRSRTAASASPPTAWNPSSRSSPSSTSGAAAPGSASPSHGGSRWRWGGGWRWSRRWAWGAPSGWTCRQRHPPRRAPEPATPQPSLAFPALPRIASTSPDWEDSDPQHPSTPWPRDTDEKTAGAAVLAILAFAACTSPAPAQDEVHTSEEHDFRVVTVASGLQNPWGLAFLPGGDILVTERPGRIRLITDGELRRAPVAGAPTAVAGGQGGMLDIALHPEFEANGLVYIAYSKEVEGGRTTAVARARWTGDALEGTEDVFVADALGGGRHYGSRIAFDPAGYMYVTVGDRGEMNRAQDLSDHAGTTIRLHDDGRVPADNPFVGRRRRPRRDLHLREPQRAGDGDPPGDGRRLAERARAAGWRRDQPDRAGLNYGWPVITHGIGYRGETIAQDTARAGMEQPVLHWTPSIAVSGMTFYSGDRFPAWRGNLFNGALRQAHLRRVVLEGDRIVHQEELLADLGQRIREVKEGPDGYLYLLTDERQGAVLRLEPVD
jgi:aldose sugar dehydrogenase